MAQSLRQQIQNDMRKFASFTSCEQIYTVREIRVATGSPIPTSTKPQSTKTTRK